MERRTDAVAPAGPVAVARIVATLLARDGRVVWREMDFIGRSAALRRMRVNRDSGWRSSRRRADSVGKARAA